MCKFCDDLDYKTITIPSRTSTADDNVCEFVVNENCNECNHGCADENNYFSITTWEDNICLNYYHKVKDLIIAPISARFSINYCPMCGKKISKEMNSEELKFW
jgi:hypothetical protein